MNFQKNNLTFEPIIVSASDPDQESLIVDLKSKAIHINDNIFDQLSDLIKTRLPSKSMSKEELENAISIHIGDCSLSKYGNWIYYPWNGHLVHTLPESEFIELRTNRNRNKITEEEQHTLSSKKIAVIGLSVGQSVSLALTMERICGELVIADFDHIDLSNLNRIRTGIYNIGVPKTTVVAREIKEIDPYFKVTVYPEGATKDNLPKILGDDQQVDILIDECDSMEMKINMRLLARTLGIPTIMDTSDRGQVDIERFDLNRQAPIFHGQIDESELESMDFNDPRTKLRVMQSIIDFTSASTRAIQSFNEIGKTLKTWPQLASSVLLGGAVTADVCRRILLNESKESGRFYVEIDKLVP